MAAQPLTPERLQVMSFPESHLDATLAFIVEDHRRDEFVDPEFLRGDDELTIGLLTDSDYFKLKLIGSHSYHIDIIF